MKKARRLLQIISVALLCMAMTVGILTVSASAETTITSVIIDGETLNETTPFLIDKDGEYIADDGELLASYSWVAQFDASTGVLVLRDYDGGAISTTATGDLTIKLMGENTIQHTAIGIQMTYGGNLTITADAAATLDIQSIPAADFSDEPYHCVGIENNFDGGYADTEESGDGVTIMGKAAVSITSTKNLRTEPLTALAHTALSWCWEMQA